YWRSHFGRDRQAIGRRILIDGTPVEIVGVSPAGFTGATVGEAAEITLAVGIQPQLYPERRESLDASSTWLRVLARPRPELPASQVKARLAAVWPDVAAAAVPERFAVARQRALTSTIDLIPGARGWSQ